MKKTKKLIDMISEQCTFLYDDYGFKVIEKDDDDMIVMESRELRLRFIKDRVDYFLDIGSIAVQDYWYDINDVIDHLFNIRGLEKIKAVNRFNAICSKLKTYFADINDLFSPSKYAGIKDKIPKR